ncbi:MAG: GDP-mannose 4,6-dehydratase [Gemmatimonadota bacterium]|nr:GDP-mannose 4,6-dehydratase [Gemmatimonadota bacterium]MDH5283261.1 GDP-mannose 4,6-dehydratase [Gemmatimonadota bacterium]
MTVLVTGAAGFVGRWLVPLLLEEGFDVSGTRMPGEGIPEAGGSRNQGVRWRSLDLADPGSVDEAVAERPEAVVHLAALASGAEARRDPGRAWEVNAAGTARLAHALGEQRSAGRSDPLLLLISTAEVYGVGATQTPRREEEPPAPVSPYASSKLGAEEAAREVARRTGLRVIIARSFPHTGPGQSEHYVVPAFARRLRAARRLGATTVRTGNLEPVRDFLDVRDVVAAYVALLRQGVPGTVYNVASGVGHSLHEVFHRLAHAAGVQVTPEVVPELTRTADLPYLVGDPSRLRAATGWSPRIPFDQTLQDVVDAQTD